MKGEEGKFEPARRQSTRALPCPFCRGRHEIVHQEYLDDDAEGNDVSCLICETCGAWGPMATGGYPAAARFWNMRNEGLEALSLAKRIEFPVKEEKEEEPHPKGANACPFCGCKDLWIHNSASGDEDCWHVGCSNCEANGPQPDINEENTEEEAIQEWNGSLITVFRHKHGDGSGERA